MPLTSLSAYLLYSNRHPVSSAQTFAPQYPIADPAASSLHRGQMAFTTGKVNFGSCLDQQVWSREAG
jgi:hypothetical protein